jgi:chorismate-pyruvate lyase
VVEEMLAGLDGSLTSLELESESAAMELLSEKFVLVLDTDEAVLDRDR